METGEFILLFFGHCDLSNEFSAIIGKLRGTFSWQKIFSVSCRPESLRNRWDPTNNHQSEQPFPFSVSMAFREGIHYLLIIWCDSDEYGRVTGSRIQPSRNCKWNSQKVCTQFQVFTRCRKEGRVKRKYVGLFCERRYKLGFNCNKRRRGPPCINWQSGRT